MSLITRFILFLTPFIISACSQQPITVEPTPANEIQQAIQSVTDVRVKSKQTDRGITLLVSDSLFETESSNLASHAEPVLDRIANLLAQYPRRNAVIEVHTDNTGGEKFNLKLSQQRAEQFRMALMQRGVTARRIIAKGYGDTRPLGTNLSEKGRLQNRRVEVSILNEGEILRF
jgi:outer membrane protein OmpA-like peptidoglycan-associated protein